MTIERPMFPPRAESVDSFSYQSGIGQPERGKLASESPIESLDLAMLRFVRCLVRCGLTLDEAGAVVTAEIEQLRKAGERKQRRRLTLVGMRLVPVAI